jgi:hypothetical protein
MRGYKIRKGVYWQGALKENGVKQVGCRTGATWTCVGTGLFFHYYVLTNEGYQYKFTVLARY